MLRLPCKSEANFDIISTDYSLVNYVIEKFTVSTKEECFERCLRMSFCKSLNHKDKGNENCELSNETNGTVGAAHLLKRDGWAYYATDYSKKNIGAYCRIAKPCGEQQYCFDSCTCPGYRCIPCGYGYFLNGDFKCNEIKECASNPCLNGGVCNDLVGKFSCQCENGYTGIRCETEINECSSNPCQNGGTCHDLVGEYRCTCKGEFKGVNCERGPTCLNRYNDGNTEDKVYNFTHMGSHFCYMTGCGGGGWTLALKASGATVNFAAYSPLWENDEVLDENMANLNNGDAKFKAFSMAYFDEICIAMKHSSETLASIKWLKISKNSSSLMDLFSSGQTLTTVSNDQWFNLISPDTIQPNCLRQGINVKDDNNRLRVRIGMLGNNEMDCRTCDSYLGVGIDHQTKVGSTAKPKQAYIFVK